ncbi:hypothetical protein [Pseudomonas poae]|uniref:hypothetical protein n=1 Tax=Pseudomonas poae TaxID=200451 RepID=UPI001645E0E8|nr:hypothetical protein [Pseudomonas poae]MBC3195746.1 hypothetical protein [Pseudomonas poae]
MKKLIALPFAVLMLASMQASALCLSINDSYTGVVKPKTAVTAYGPFSITSANGCLTASVDAMVSIGGAGKAPEIYIEREVGASWKRETYSVGNNASYVGPFGRYRVILNKDSDIPKSYSGTVRYGR